MQLALSLVAASAGLSACWTSAADGESLRRRVRELETGQTAQRDELRTELANAQTKVADLEEVLDRATKLVTRNSADTGAQVEELQQQVMALEGQLAELRNDLARRQQQDQERQTALDQQLQKIARAAGVDMAIDESQIPADADAHWTEAERAFAQREYSRARGLYRAFIARHGDDNRVDDAQYKIGASYLEENRPATALGELQRVIADHRDGDAADDALLGMARAFYALHACSDARTTIQALQRAHPRSPLLGDARALLRTVNAAPRGYCTS
ncbi:MAG: tetratricopeptide repeat protein [Sandaracinaceae bacterium]